MNTLKVYGKNYNKFFIIRGGYLIKYILIIGFVCLTCIALFALLKVASDCDDKAEEFYRNFYEDGLGKEYDYYDNKYKEIIDNNKDI